MSDRYEVRRSEIIHSLTESNGKFGDKFFDWGRPWWNSGHVDREYIVLRLSSRRKIYFVFKTTLCSAIPYFDKMFSSRTQESSAKDINTGRFQINTELDYPTEILDIIIDWAQNKTICITNENVLELMELACFMCITELVEKCEAFCASRSYSSNRLTPCSSIKYLDHKFSDLTIKNKGKRYYVHKIILCSAIPFFKNMFSSGTKELNISETEFSNWSTEIFEVIIDWAYHKRICIIRENVNELRHLAFIMRIDELYAKCMKFTRDYKNLRQELQYSLNTYSSIKYLDDKFSDLTIINKGRVYNVHKIILCSAIPYFGAMFSSCWKESTASQIELDYPIEIFELIIDWAYHKRILLTPENVSELQKLADYLCITDLFRKCETFAKIFHDE